MARIPRGARLRTAALAATVVVGVAAPTAAAHDGGGAVYTETNAAGGNAVVAFSRDAHGGLAPLATVPTGGTGTGAGLGSQGAVALAAHGRLLFAVDAGSDSISSFRIRDDGTPVLAGTYPSGGDQPISVTVRGRVLYALNAASGTIAGFLVGPHGGLWPIPGTTRSLAGGTGAGPAQIAFVGDDALAVTEKATNQIDLFPLRAGGLRVGEARATASAGTTPFGFDVDRHGRLYVSEAFGGMPDASAVSSYATRWSAGLRVITPSAGTTETAACWVVVSRDGDLLYTTNTGSGTVSGYTIGHDGSITLLDADGVTADTGAGSKPADVDLARGGHVLAVLEGGTGSVSTWSVDDDGSLTAVDEEAGLPASAAGLATR